MRGQLWYRDRKFFNTINDRVGLASSDMMPGDVICVLDNEFPVFLLRYSEATEEKKDNVARSVRDAYVHGRINLRVMPDEGRGPSKVFFLG
jgi:hypothetical protein